MKKTSLFSTAAIAITFGAMSMLQSCTQSASDLLQFEVPVQSGSEVITIAPIDTAGTFTLPPTSTSLNVDSLIKLGTNNKLGITNISSVKILSCELKLNNATATNNFANFESCNASLTSSTESTPFVLTVSNPDTYSESLTLPVDPNKELKSYMGNSTGLNTFNYTITGTVRRKTTDSLKCTITYKFKAIVKG
jgi:hypothetical protein